MKTFKQKALEALESLVAQDVPGESKIINIYNSAVHLCIDRIEAIEEDEPVKDSGNMSKEIFFALDNAMKKNCYDLCPELTSHDNTGFWIGFGKATEIMKEAYSKK